MTVKRTFERKEPPSRPSTALPSHAKTKLTEQYQRKATLTWTKYYLRKTPPCSMQVQAHLRLASSMLEEGKPRLEESELLPAEALLKTSLLKLRVQNYKTLHVSSWCQRNLYLKSSHEHSDRTIQYIA